MCAVCMKLENRVLGCCGWKKGKITFGDLEKEMQCGSYGGGVM